MPGKEVWIMKTDSQLQSDAEAELEWRPGVDEAHIGVSAADGVVTLTGQVSHYTEKIAAEEAAKAVYGVKGIANDIKVEIPGALKQTDQDIAKAVLERLKWDWEVPNDKVKVVVKDGWITLDGTVDWQYQKIAADRCVRYLLGVVGVINDITIKPAVKASDVENKIEKAFRRNAALDAEGVSIKADGGVITLTGTVSSWDEFDEAATAAWAAPGVTSVHNNLNVVS
jgi:osmotically-inducible protein OsmY